MSHTDGGLLTVISSGVAGWVSGGQGPEGNMSCLGVEITLGGGVNGG